MSDNTEPAFPNFGEIFVDGPQGRGPQSAWGMEGAKGLTKREYFAAAALTGLLASSSEDDEVGRSARNNSAKAAAWAYEFADAMIEAGRKQP